MNSLECQHFIRMIPTLGNTKPYQMRTHSVHSDATFLDWQTLCIGILCTKASALKDALIQSSLTQLLTEQALIDFWKHKKKSTAFKTVHILISN